ncbi:MAG: hypothetical protein LBM87_04875 [Ruminococcus sp.]|nr:hypothetical protein [Ruminococcus sp.]
MSLNIKTNIGFRTSKEIEEIILQIHSINNFFSSLSLAQLILLSIEMYKSSPIDWAIVNKIYNKHRDSTDSEKSMLSYAISSYSVNDMNIIKKSMQASLGVKEPLTKTEVSILLIFFLHMTVCDKNLKVFQKSADLNFNPAILLHSLIDLVSEPYLNIERINKISKILTEPSSTK